MATYLVLINYINTNKIKDTYGMQMKRIYIVLITTIILTPSGIYSQAYATFDTAMFTAYGIYHAMELNNSTVREKAYALSASNTNDYTGQVCTIFDYMYYNWNYVNDPGGMEYFADATETLETMTGDCDDYAIAMVSMLSNLGGDGRVICVSGHAYPEMYLGKDLDESTLIDLKQQINSHYEKLYGRKNKVRNMHYRRDYDGTYWLNLDWQSDHPGGRWVDDSSDAQFLVIYTNGTWRQGYLNNE
ncbi:MAG: transglutaminase domain-containing protein [Ignavibacteriae bacterium]|nr:MAG: transglutaminase domain-containing protein [Ignavibacteriota bacterium]